MSNYVIISYNNNRSYLAKLKPNSYYRGIFQLTDLSGKYYTRDNGRDLYVNSDLKVCGCDGRDVCNYSVDSVEFVTNELIFKLKKHKTELKEVIEILSNIDSTVLKFLHLHLDSNRVSNMDNIVTEFESLVLENKSVSYEQYENLFKNSDKPVLCKVSNKSDTLSSSTVFKVIKKEFNILNDSFVTIDNEKYLFVEPLDYRL